MGNVVIAQNLVKTTERININGDVINPITKQIIKPAEVPYVPVPLEVKDYTKDTVIAETGDWNKRVVEVKSDALGDKIEKMIEAKINKLVEEKITKVLEKLL